MTNFESGARLYMHVYVAHLEIQRQMVFGDVETIEVEWFGGGGGGGGVRLALRIRSLDSSTFYSDLRI